MGWSHFIHLLKKSIKDSILNVDKRPPFVVKGLQVEEHETLFVSYSAEGNGVLGRKTLAEFTAMFPDKNSNDKLHLDIAIRDENGDIITVNNRKNSLKGKGFATCIIDANFNQSLREGHWHTAYCE